jgi:hypothetical protein
MYVAHWFLTYSGSHGISWRVGIMIHTVPCFASGGLPSFFAQIGSIVAEALKADPFHFELS